MQHLAVDLGGKESQLCIRLSDSKILLERRILTSQLPSFFKVQPPSRVILETGAEAFTIADAALAGHEVRVVPATLVRTLGVGSRGMKSDRRDAQILSEVSCRIDLPTVHVPSHRSREWKAMCGMRQALVDSRTKMVNTVRGWMRGRLTRVALGTVSTLPSRVRKKCPDLPQFVERQLSAIEQLSEMIRAYEKDFAAMAELDPVCRRLMTIPGVGPLVAIRFVSAVDDLSRFEGPHALQSYLGLTPGEDSSSERHRITGITKAGNSRTRWILVQAAWTVLRCRAGDPMAQWAEQIAARKGKKPAVIALARKLAGIMFAIWRDGSEYNPTKGAKSETPRVYVMKPS
jgi:transposase